VSCLCKWSCTHAPGRSFSLAEIAESCGVSRERIRQVEQQAFFRIHRQRLLDKCGITKEDLATLQQGICSTWDDNMVSACPL